MPVHAVGIAEPLKLRVWLGFDMVRSAFSRDLLAGGCRLTVHVLLGRGGTKDSVDGEEAREAGSRGCGDGRGGGERRTKTGPLSTDVGSDHDPRMLPGGSIRSLSLHPFTLQLLRSQEANAAALGASLVLFHLPDDGLGASLRPQLSGQLWSSQAWLLRGPLRQ